MDHATPAACLFLIVAATIIIVFVVLAQRGRRFFIRRIPGLTAIDEAVGRAAEMGRPLIASIGLGGLNATTGVITLQAMAIVSFIAETAAKFGNRLIVPMVDPSLIPIAEESLREAYAKGGRPESFHTEDIVFLSDQQFAYAAGVAGMINREKAASIFLFGTFYAESLIIAENGNRIGAIQVAGTPSTTQIPFFIAACDYVIIGDEYYAATAYLTRQPTLVGAIVGQDIVKGVVLACVLIGALAMSFLHVPLMQNLFADKPVPFADLLHAVAATAGKRGG